MFPGLLLGCHVSLGLRNKRIVPYCKYSYYCQQFSWRLRHHKLKRTEAKGPVWPSGGESTVPSQVVGVLFATSFGALLVSLGSPPQGPGHADEHRRVPQKVAGLFAGVEERTLEMRVLLCQSSQPD